MPLNDSDCITLPNTESSPGTTQGGSSKVSLNCMLDCHGRLRRKMCRTRLLTLLPFVAWGVGGSLPELTTGRC